MMRPVTVTMMGNADAATVKQLERPGLVRPAVIGNIIKNQSYAALTNIDTLYFNKVCFISVRVTVT